MFKSLAPVLARSARVRPLPRTALYPLAARYNSTSTTTPAPTRECPACHKPIPLPASPCHSCGALIRIPQGLSLHSLLSVSDPIPVAGKPKFDIQAELEHLPSYGYDLDPRELHIQFLRRQRDLHPDKHGAIGNDVDLAADLSGEVNKAYETLKSPLKRAEYILKQCGLDVSETDHVADHDLLMEILDARETLEEADRSEVEELRDDNRERIKGVIEKLKEAFSKNPPDLKGAKELAVELKYWVGLEEAAKEKL